MASASQYRHHPILCTSALNPSNQLPVDTETRPEIWQPYHMCVLGLHRSMSAPLIVLQLWSPSPHPYDAKLLLGSRKSITVEIYPRSDDAHLAATLCVSSSRWTPPAGIVDPATFGCSCLIHALLAINHNVFSAGRHDGQDRCVVDGKYYTPMLAIAMTQERT